MEEAVGDSPRSPSRPRILAKHMRKDCCRETVFPARLAPAQHCTINIARTRMLRLLCSCLLPVPREQTLHCYHLHSVVAVFNSYLLCDSTGFNSPQRTGRRKKEREIAGEEHPLAAVLRTCTCTCTSRQGAPPSLCVGVFDCLSPPTSFASACIQIFVRGRFYRICYSVRQFACVQACCAARRVSYHLPPAVFFFPLSIENWKAGKDPGLSLDRTPHRTEHQQLSLPPFSSLPQPDRPGFF